MRADESGSVESKQFEELYLAEHQKMLQYASTLFSSSETVGGRAEEAVQETFAFAWERRDELFSSPKPVGWLYQVLKYKIKELLAADRQWTKKMMDAADQYEERDFTDVSTEVALKEILSNMDYQILKKLYIEGRSYQELCQESGMKKSALGMKVKRLKEKFIKDYFV